MPPSTTVAPQTPAPPSSPIKNAYLIVYNALSAIAWGLVLQSTVLTLFESGPSIVYLTTGEFTKWTQTAAAMEIIHSLFGKPSTSLSKPMFFTNTNDTEKTGIVRAPLLTTLMQVSSRFLLVWGVVHLYPHLAIESPTYSSMLIAWSVTEVIRYSYFALSLSGYTPRLLTWLRYNTFFILYPIGILSECSLVFLAAVGPAAAEKEYPLALAPYALYAILIIYVPG